MPNQGDRARSSHATKAEAERAGRWPCSLAAVERVRLVRPAGAPEWIEEGQPAEARLRDEDVAAALREQHQSQRALRRRVSPFARAP